MARPRTELQTILERILGSRNVYFQPPESFKMNYPCIVYEKSSMYTNHADNSKYRKLNRYTITVIDKNPDSTVPDKIADLQYCSFDRTFRADNLNHSALTLYF